MIKKHRNHLIYILIIAIILLQSIPVFKLKPIDNNVLTGHHVNVYYEATDEKGGTDVFNTLEACAEKIKNKLNYTSTDIINVYVYKTHFSFYIRNFGLISPLFLPNWYIVNNKKNSALITSPYAKALSYDYDSIILASIYSLINSMNHQINPKLSYWLNNGIAGYLCGKEPSIENIDLTNIPSYRDTHIENEIKFKNIDGYLYSYLYIKFLDEVYGWDKVLDILHGNLYNIIFGKSEEDIYNQWVEYLNLKYK